jgi:hypothetical protein
MNRGVAMVLDDTSLGDERWGNEFDEGRFVDAGSERCVVWVLQACIIRVKPLDGSL